MKPTIFFSHSSLDSERIKPIKDYILEKTSNVVNIFMSSDGASIPFGKNWIKEIEDALINCKIMFVWVTPNSVTSNWLFFESGYAYSRGIKVIPIGFDSINLEELPAPLNLLQGFNINSSSSLNNIIAVINREFNLTFPNIFDEDFYEKYVDKYSYEKSPEILNYVRGLSSKFDKKIKIDQVTYAELNKTWPKIFMDILKKFDEKFTFSSDARIYGVGYKIYPRPRTGFSIPEIFIDPLSLNNFWSILQEFHKKAYDNKLEKVILKVLLDPSYDLPEDHFLISSRLVNTEVDFISSRLVNTEVDFNTQEPHVIYKFRNILFRINIYNERKSRPNILSRELVILADNDMPDTIPLLALVKLLLKQRLISER